MGSRISGTGKVEVEMKRLESSLNLDLGLLLGQYLSNVFENNEEM